MKGPLCFLTEVRGRGKPSTALPRNAWNWWSIVRARSDQPTSSTWLRSQRSEANRRAPCFRSLTSPLKTNVTVQPEHKITRIWKRRCSHFGLSGSALYPKLFVLVADPSQPSDLICSVSQTQQAAGNGWSWAPCGLGKMVKVLENEGGVLRNKAVHWWGHSSC